MKKEKEVIDFTDKIDRLLNKKPKSGSKKEWIKKWDKLMKEFLGDEDTERKSTRKKTTEEKG